MVLQKKVGKKPQEVAKLLKDNLVDPNHSLTSVEIAGPGFLNIRVAPELWFHGLAAVLAAPATFGQSKVGKGEKVLVEFVSANPTGPLHLGHGRGAVVGDVLVRLLKNAGYDVSSEYYINDAGGQTKALGRTLHMRYAELFGRKADLGVAADAPPEVAHKAWLDHCAKHKYYPGEYAIGIAEQLKAKYGDKMLDAPESEWLTLFTDLGMEEVLKGIKDDLEQFGIHFDKWFSERSLHASGAVAKTIEDLKAQGLVYWGTLPPPKSEKLKDDEYEPREQWLFKSTAFGDDTDRGLIKEDGSYTYFGADIAYHANKVLRDYKTLINIWGADHTGAIKRLQAAVQALSGRKDALEVVLIQLVNLYKDGKPVRMGKRSGNFVALRDVLDEAGRDATRFFFVMRASTTTLDFHLDLAKKQDNDNPVYYVQMGHARICSILRKAKEAGHADPTFDLKAVSRLTRPDELELLKRILDWPDLVAGAAKAREPHRVVFYLQETIAAFHSYFTRGKVEKFRIIGEDKELTQARLLMCQGLQLVLKSALGVLGVSAPEQMLSPEPEAEEV
jgi:arginyl-tRNA synthetase